MRDNRLLVISCVTCFLYTYVVPGLTFISTSVPLTLHSPVVTWCSVSKQPRGCGAGHRTSRKNWGSLSNRSKEECSWYPETCVRDESGPWRRTTSLSPTVRYVHVIRSSVVEVTVQEEGLNGHKDRCWWTEASSEASGASQRSSAVPSVYNHQWTRPRRLNLWEKRQSSWDGVWTETDVRTFSAPTLCELVLYICALKFTVNSKTQAAENPQTFFARLTDWCWLLLRRGNAHHSWRDIYCSKICQTSTGEAADLTSEASNVFISGALVFQLLMMHWFMSICKQGTKSSCIISHWIVLYRMMSDQIRSYRWHSEMILYDRWIRSCSWYQWFWYQSMWFQCL